MHGPVQLDGGLMVTPELLQLNRHKYSAFSPALIYITRADTMEGPPDLNSAPAGI